MRVLLTETAYDHFGDAVLGVAPGIEAVVMDVAGALRRPASTSVDWPEANVEVAWATADLFAAGAPIRPFFGFVTRSTTLRWLASPAAGVDDPVFAGLLARGVRVTSAHVNSIPIAEYVVRAVLDRFQRADIWRRAEHDGTWARHDFREVFGSTWLIVGVGSIGAEVARRARAFGANVIGVRRQPTGDEPVDEMIAPAQIPAYLPAVDIVVLAAPATTATEGLVNSAFLSVMKPDSVLVNVARGSLIDESALIQALDRGVPDFAALDVFDTEPLPSEHPFWSHPKISVTAHNAAGGTGRYGRAAELFVTNLGRYLSALPLHHEVTQADMPT